MSWRLINEHDILNQLYLAIDWHWKMNNFQLEGVS